MAGFRIEYSGSAVQRKDVPQATGNSSLTQQSTVPGLPTATLEGNATPLSAGAGNGVTNYEASPYPGARSYDWFVQNGTPVVASGSGIGFVSHSAGGNQYVYLVSPVFSNTTTVEIRGQKTDGTGGAWLYHSGLPSRTSGTLWNLNGTGGSTYFVTTYVVPAGQYFIFAPLVNSSYYFAFDYIRFTEASPVVINTTTFVNGVNATGGSPVSTLITTEVTGAPAVSTPAKEFGLVLKHNGDVISDLKYLPPAQISQNATVTLHDEGIITATATTISAEGEGLGGSDKLRALDTRVLVENYDEAVEN